MLFLPVLKKEFWDGCIRSAKKHICLKVYNKCLYR